MTVFFAGHSFDKIIYFIIFFNRFIYYNLQGSCWMNSPEKAFEYKSVLFIEIITEVAHYGREKKLMG